MGTRRSFEVEVEEKFHSMEFLFDLNTRRETAYLQATRYYFVYHINTIALYWEEKPTSLMNENK